MKTRKPIVAALGVAALALVARLVYLHVAGAAGLFEGLFLDSKYYAEQAAAIRLGHGAGSHPYILSPLYPYVLALFTNAGGAFDAGTVRVLQAIVGSATAALVLLIATRIAGARAGWVAGILAAIHAPLIHADALLVVSCLQGFFIALGVAGLVLTVDEVETAGHTQLVRWFGAGACFGLAASLHATSLSIPASIVAASWIGAWIARRSALPWRSLLARSGAHVAGVALAIAPFTIRNAAAGGELTLLSSNGGISFYVGNSSSATGLFHTPPGYDFASDPVGKGLAERAAGRQLTYGEASSWWRERALDDIRADPLRWVGLLGKKALLFLHSEEIPQLGESFRWFRERAWPLRFPLDARILFLFALLAPVVIILRGGRSAALALRWPLLSTAAFGSMIALFFVTGRYRAPIMPLVIALASIGACELYELVFRGDWKKPGLVLGVLAAWVALFFASWWLYDSPHAPLAIPTSSGLEERHQGMSLYQQGRYAEAVDAYLRSLAINDDPGTRTNLANALKALGRIDEAAAQYELALRDNPHDGVSWYNYGNLLRKQSKDLRGAKDAYEKSIAELPNMAEAHFNLGATLLELDLPEDAAAEIESALSLAPPTASWRKQAEDALVIAHLRKTHGKLELPKIDGADEKKE